MRSHLFHAWAYQVNVESRKKTGRVKERVKRGTDPVPAAVRPMPSGRTGQLIGSVRFHDECRDIPTFERFIAPVLRVTSAEDPLGGVIHGTYLFQHLTPGRPRHRKVKDCQIDAASFSHKRCPTLLYRLPPAASKLSDFPLSPAQPLAHSILMPASRLGCGLGF